MLGVIFLIISLFSFAKDNYIFDENRIRQVFSEYELLEYQNSPYIRLDLLDRERDTRIQISSYATGDSIAKARERFHQFAIDDKSTPVNRVNQLSENRLGQDSTSYIRRTPDGIRKDEHFFFDKVKMSIDYAGDDRDYENVLQLVKEAIDPSVPLRSRPRKTFSQNYSIGNFVDRRKLEANFRKEYRNIKVEEIKGTTMDLSTYKVTIESGRMPRAIWISSNNNYSKRVIERENDFEVQSLARKDAYGRDHAFVRRGEESKVTPRYFGVNANVYENDYMLRELNVAVVGVRRYAITDKYTVGAGTFIIDGNKEEEMKEYEKFLSLIKASLR